MATNTTAKNVFPKLRILSKNQENTCSQKAGTIGAILMSGKLSCISNIKISPSIKATFFKAIKEEKQSLQESRIAERKVLSEKEKEYKKFSNIEKAKHASFVKCIVWTKSIDTEKLEEEGVL